MTETCEMPRREIGLPYQVAPSIHPAGARVFGGCAMKLPYRSIPQMQPVLAYPRGQSSTSFCVNGGGILHEV